MTVSALPLGIKRDTANATAIAIAKDSKARQVLMRFRIAITTRTNSTTLNHPALAVAEQDTNFPEVVHRTLSGLSPVPAVGRLQPMPGVVRAQPASRRHRSIYSA